MLCGCYSFKPFYHGEHGSHGDETYDEEDAPADPEGEGVVHQRSDPEQEVAQCGGAEPESLTESLHVGGCYF